MVSPFILTEGYAMRLNLMGTTELTKVGRLPLTGLLVEDGGQLYHHLLSLFAWASHPLTQACTRDEGNVEASTMKPFDQANIR